MHKYISIVSAFALYKKEVKRFLNVFNQTLISPLISSLIYLAIFRLSIGSHIVSINNIAFLEFIAPGIIIMSSMQNAFANTSSSLMMARITGTIVDYIIPPFSPLGLTFALTLGGATRGIFVGIIVALSLKFFVDIKIYSLFYCLFYLILSSILLGLIGIIASIFSSSYDQMSSFSTYIITPLSFLSGTFYSVNNLPHWAKIINLYNPFFYIIDGFRYGLTGSSDISSLATGVAITTFYNLLLLIIVYNIFRSGYKIKN